MKLTQRQKIIVGIVIGLFILGVSLIIYFTTKKCTPNCTGKNCGDDDGCEGKCKDNCPGYRCKENVCTEGDPCTNGETGCYSDSSCDGKCDQPVYSGIRFRKNYDPTTIYFDVQWSDFSLVESTTKLELNNNYKIYLNTSSISKFWDISQSSFKFNDGSSVMASNPTNIKSVEYLNKPPEYYPDLLCTSNVENYPTMSNSSTKTMKNQLDVVYGIRYICIFRPIFLRIYQVDPVNPQQQQSTVYFDLYLKQFYPLFSQVTFWNDAYKDLYTSGFFYGIDICTMQKDNFTFNNGDYITTTNVDTFEVMSSEENPTPFVMKYANSCLLDNHIEDPSIFEISITPNSGKKIPLGLKSAVTFFSF